MKFGSSLDSILILVTFVSLASCVPTSVPRSRRVHAQIDKRALYANHFPVPGINVTYDYIVVGGGTAGLAVAHRLAESGVYTVAVIEAGGFYEQENGNVSVVPGLSAPYDQFTADSTNVAPLVDWGFLTTPQAPLNNRTLHYSRGKTLGGSSAENAMVYNRGTTGSFEMWAQLVNDSSWTFDALLPYFRKGTNYTLANSTLRASNATVPTPSNTTYSATGGPLHVSYNNFALPFSSWAKLGFRAIGIPDVSDFLGGRLLGSQYAPLTLDPQGQVRGSSEETFLQASFASGRTNLKVYTHTLAKRLVFSPEVKGNGTASAAPRRAVGVKVKSASFGNQNTYTLSANKEIIVSAGAFQSPQLLMVSGIGPRKTLRKHNIPVIADRPGVGQNMWDHYDIEVTYQVNVDTQNSLTDPAYATKAAEDWNSNPSTGILTSCGADYIGWEKLPNRTALGAEAVKALSVFPADWPEVEYEIGSVYRNMSNANNYGTVVIIGVAPLSRGNVTIKSNDMSVAPVINPNWLADPTDQKVAIEAVKRMQQLFRSDAMSPVILSGSVAPTDAVQTDEEIFDYIKTTGFMNWHASCTCKMGVRSDPMAVVDSKARVIGVDGLRVVDASSFALLTPGHPMSTIYVFAEKASADILRDAAASE